MKMAAKQLRPDQILARWFVFFVLLIVAAYTVAPLIAMVFTVAKDQGDITDPFSIPKTFGMWTNFADAWGSGHFSIYTKNSFLITIPTVLIVLALSTLAGYSFAKLRYRGRNLLYYLFILGMMVPFQSVMIPLYVLLANLNLLDTHYAVILTISSSALPFGIFMMRSFYLGLSDSLIEAGRIDGCSDLMAFWYIVVPLTKPAWTSLLIFQTMWTWNNFIVPLITIYDDSLRPLPLGLMAYQARFSTNYTLVAAGVIIMVIPLVLMFIFLQRRFISSITLGALKG